MPQIRRTPEQLQELQDFAAQWGKIIARRAFGDEGPSLEVDLDAMEQVAQAAAKGIIEGTLQAALEQQALKLTDQQPCPECQSLCPVKRKPRTVTVQGAKILQSEPVCHCPVCRRDFFPPTDSSAS